MAKLKGGSRIYGNVTVDTSVLAATVNASTVNASSFILANGVDLIVLAQTGGSTSNDAYAQANSARDQANTGYGKANAAYGQANSAYDTANNAYVQANAAYAQANAGYGQANDAYGQANAAYGAANNAKVTVFANSGAANVTTQVINFVNTASILVTVANTSGNANVTFDINGTPYDTANGAYAQANTARDIANGAYAQANGAYGQANGAYAHANIVYAQANSSYDQANSARDQANTARGNANDAYSQANSARDQANSAYGAANLKLNLTGGSLTGTLNVEGDLRVTNGNIYLTGNTTFINVATYSVDDPLIYIAANNDISDVVDIGFVGAKNTSGTYNHTGLARHAADGIWYLFDNLADEGHINNIVDVANSTYAMLRANIEAKSVNVGTVPVANTNHANGAYNQANAAYGQANSARDQANSAYNAANNAQVTVYANSASAKTTQKINFVNTASIQVTVSADGSNANVEFVTIGDLSATTIQAAYGQANTARNTANDAYGQANTARNTANAAYSQANTSYLPAVTRLDVTNNGATAYRFDQYGAAVDDPTLYVRTGETISFNLNNAGHPFAIRVSNGGANYDTGLTHVATDGTVSTGSSAQGKVSGTLYWKVPYELGGNTYVYQCTVHSGMVGNIVIEPDSTIIYAQANAARGQANTARNTANDAYGAANTAGTNALNAYAQANTARTTANDAYNAANTAQSTAQNAYGQANSARDQANTAYGQANTARDTANGAYAQANGAYAHANIVYGQANAAYGQANSARDTANGAYAQANGAYAQANGAYAQANGAYGQANSAANTVWVYANGGSILAKSNLNFNNTATVNVSVTANGTTQSNIEFNANATSIGTGITLKGAKDFVVANTNTTTANTVDLTTSNYFRHVLTGSTTFTFTNAPTSGTGQMFSILMIQDATGGRTPSWANTIYWAGGTAPPATTTANARDLWTFITYDGGTTYWGTLTIKDAR